MRLIDTTGEAARRRRALRVVLTAALLGMAACEGLLEVDTPDRLPAGELESPARAELLVNSAVGDFECAFGAYVVAGGLIGEELVDATQTANRYPYDQRNLIASDSRYSTSGCEAIGVYTPLSTARASADNVLRKLEGWTDAQVPGRTRLAARAATYAGYTLTLLGEGFCTATIASFDAAGNVIYGHEMKREEILAEAEGRFTRAIEAATAADDREMLHAALVGRARVRLNLGRYADARADAARIPAGFALHVSASGASTRRQNRVWSESSELREASSVGAPYFAMNDLRVPVRDRNRASVTKVPIREQRKYTSESSPIPLATYEEARLIIAEADARANALPNALAIIGEMRQRGGQGAFTGTSQAEVLAEVVDQRRRELFLESHHLGDVIRYGIALQPAAGTTFHGGGVYGNQLCMPLPDVERNSNPNIS